MHPLIIRSITYPSYKYVQRLKGYKTATYEEELTKSQWFTPSQIEELQQEKLRALFEHAYTNVTFYRRIFDKLRLKPSDIRDLEDLNKLPLLRKEEIRRHIPALIAKNIAPKKLSPMLTSGTTGPALKLFKTKDRDAWRAAARHRWQKAYGFELGDKMVSIYGHAFPRNYIFQGAFHRIVKNDYIPYGYNLNEEIGEFVKKMKSYNPAIMRAWPSTIYPIAKYAGNNGIELQPKSIWLYGEVLFKFQRQLIEENLSHEIFDAFGLRESSVFSFACREHAGYHLDAENGIIEVLNPEGDQASAGELGATVFTDLTNFAMPLIRYVSEDLVTYAGGRTCPCGRGLPLVITSVEGRFSDCLSTGGGFVLPRSTVDLFSSRTTIKSFQVIQKAIDKIEIKLENNSDLSSSDADYIVGGIQNLVKSKDVNIELQSVNAIPLTSSGKTRFVISEAPPEFIGT
jgi:phenylacetate-CoA ligase